MSHLPTSEDVLGCDPNQASYTQCIYKRIQEQLQLFISSNVDPSNKRARVTMEANINLKELLENRQTKILKTVQTQGFSLTKMVHNRFGELKSYFYRVQDLTSVKPVLTLDT